MTAVLRHLCIILLICLAANSVHAQKDTIPPVVQLKGDSIVMVHVHSTYQEQGLIITDNRDTINTWDTLGNFYKLFPNGKPNKLGTYTLTYRVKDKSNNTDTVVRYIDVIDTIAPVMRLIGTKVVCKNERQDWEEITDSIWEVWDNYRESANDLTITRLCAFNDYPKAGTYKYGYKLCDKSGNIGYSDWRYVIVKAANDTSSCSVKDTSNAICAGEATSIIEDPGSSGFKLYPMPANNTLHIVLNSHPSTMPQFRVWDITGRVFPVRLHGLGGGAHFEINTSELPAGMYVLELNTSAGRKAERFYVVH